MPRFLHPKIKLPVPVNKLSQKSPDGSPADGHKSTYDSCQSPVPQINCFGPTHAPIAAHSFTSPMPMPPIQARMPNSNAPSPIPSRLWRLPIPCHLAGPNDIRSPATRNGSTSQLGMRRLRKSVKVDTATNDQQSATTRSSATLAPSSPLKTLDCCMYAIVPPNPDKSRTYSFNAIHEVVDFVGVHGCLRTFACGEARRIHFGRRRIDVLYLLAANGDNGEC